MREEEHFKKLCSVVDTLLGENGCAWDKAQTHESMRQNLLEESYETAEAIDQGDMPALCEEIGDLLLQVMMHSRVAEKAGNFCLADVMQGAADKLVRRHTHIFAAEGQSSALDSAQTAEEVEKIWEANKIKEKSLSNPVENMRAVAKALPALERAQKVIKRSGEDFSQEALINELQKLLASVNDENDEKLVKGSIMETCGRILLLMAALSTKMQINAEFSLTNAIQEFINKFE